MPSHRVGAKFSRVLKRMSPASVTRSRIAKKTIMRFADRVGLLYFGIVDQRDDEHRLVRGYTTSATHRDNHYCIGTINGYDVMLVLRNDFAIRPGYREVQSRHWLIFTFDLHTTRDVPHVYIGRRTPEEAARMSYLRLAPLALGSLHAYSLGFVQNYCIYARATHAIDIEAIITPQIADTIAERFVDTHIEIEDRTVYLHIESARPTEALLEKMLANGLWLAGAIDNSLQNQS